MLKYIKKNRVLIILSLVIFLVVSFGIFMISNEVLAQETDAQKCEEAGKIFLQTSIPGIGNCVAGFPEYVQAIYNLFIGIIGILAVIMIMMGGFQWLLAAGNAQKITGAKTTIMSAVMGLILALTSYTILDLINPNLTVLQLRNLIPIDEDFSRFNYCPRGDDFLYAEVTGSKTFAELDSGDVVDGSYIGDFKIIGDEARCGKTYYIREKGGNTCDGKICSENKYYCYEGGCYDSEIFGHIICDSDDGDCVDLIEIMALCYDPTPSDPARRYSPRFIGSENTEENAVRYKLDYRSGNVMRICYLATNTDRELKGFYFTVEAKASGNFSFDKDRGLASIDAGGGNYYKTSGPLAGCRGKDTDEFTDVDWQRAVNQGHILPINVLAEDNLPLIYDIVLIPINQYLESTESCD